ncbi:MAG: glycosyltransferase family 1 protein [Acidobacteria bacterium]|nr:MAG: glycosyltransferase family 1 protein [Acidobacteriota bacterium]
MSRRPFVLHFVCSSLGGAAHHLSQLIEQPTFRDYRIGVIMPEDGDARVVRDIVGTGAELITLGSRRQLSWADTGRLPGLLKRFAPDVFHLHGLRASTLGRLAVLAVSNRPKIVYTVHGFHVLYYPPLRRRAALILERSLARLTDRFICVSEADSRALVACRVTNPSRVTTILNGIDLKPTETNVAEEFRLVGKKVITTVCRLHPQKDLDTLIEAFSLVSDRHPEAVLLLVGDGPLRSSLEANVTARGLDGKVIFTGTRADVEAFLRVTDVFCLSSRWEGTALVLIEAMAARLPVVASDVEGIREVVINGDTGILTSPRDPTSLADALSRCLSDPVLSERLAAAGRDRYTKIFTAARMAAETEAVYREVLGKAQA